MKPYYLFLLFIFSASFAKAQDCSSIKQGTFYEYPRNSYVSYTAIVIRKDSIEKIVSGLLGDTSYWKINFTKDCVIIMKLIRTEPKRPYKDNRYGDNYIQEVTKITKEYYAFRGYWQSHPEHQDSDTAWMFRRY